MTVTVTGASGHVGANLVHALCERGEKVRVLIHRDSRALEGLGVERIQGDVLDLDSLCAAFDGADVVYHLAAYISLLDEHERLERINVGGTANVIEACRRTGVGRLVHTSSIEALLHPGCPRPLAETNPPSPEAVTTAYGQSKSRGCGRVLAAIEQGLDAVIVNPTAVIGPRDHKPSHFGRMFVDFARRKLPALVGGGFDLVDARDVAAGMLAAADRGRCGEMYLLSGEYTPVARLAEILEQHTGARRPRLTMPMWLAGFGALFTPPYYKLSGAQPRFTRMSIRMLAGEYRVAGDKAASELGYSARPVSDSVRDAVAWFRDKGMIAAASATPAVDGSG